MNLIDEIPMDTQQEVLSMLDDVLGLGARTRQFTSATPLLGALPELDSMAVLNLVSAMEDRFGFSVDDTEISGETFASVGSLVQFVSNKLG